MKIANIVKLHYGNTLYETMMSDIGNDLAYARKLTVTGFPVYGSSRLGEKQANKLVYNTSFTISGVDGEGTMMNTIGHLLEVIAYGLTNSISTTMDLISFGRIYRHQLQGQ